MGTVAPNAGVEKTSLSAAVIPMRPLMISTKRAGKAASEPYAPDPAADDRIRILVAEDHPDSRDALHTLLQAYGYEVYLAPNGQAAIDRAAEVQPDIILMDIMMPGVDGLEATRRLRADPAFQSTPILALTAMEGGREKALEAGCDDFIAKPIRLKNFVDTLERWIR